MQKHTLYSLGIATLVLVASFVLIFPRDKKEDLSEPPVILAEKEVKAFHTKKPLDFFESAKQTLQKTKDLTKTKRRDWKTCAALGYPVKYDQEIRKAVIKHWPLEWQVYHCWWRAQLARESSLNIKHCLKENRARAKCLAQLLPGTAAQIEKMTGLTQTRKKAKAAIYGGAWYMNWQAKGWPTPRSALCRLELSQAGYVSGRGHIYNAQKEARKDGKIAICFEEMLEYLPQVIANHNAIDAINYVTSIGILAQQMEGRRP